MHRSFVSLVHIEKNKKKKKKKKKEQKKNRERGREIERREREMRGDWWTLPVSYNNNIKHLQNNFNYQ